MPTPTPPRGLGDRGQGLWDSIIPGYQLKPDEVQILIDACREADLIERLYQELEDGGTVTRGSMGQEVASAQLSEVRQHRALLNTLLKALHLPETPASTARKRAEVSEKARMAARTRWGSGAGTG